MLIVYYILLVLVAITLLLAVFLLIKHYQVTANPGIIAVPLDEDSVHSPTNNHDVDLDEEEHHSDHGFEHSDEEQHEEQHKSLTSTLRRAADHVMQTAATVTDKVQRSTARMRSSGDSSQGEYEMIGKGASSVSSLSASRRFTIADEEDPDDDDDEHEIAFHNPLNNR